MFPRLPADLVPEFVVALVIAAAVLGILGLLRVSIPAAVLGAAFLPVLFLLSTFEVQVPRGHPRSVVWLAVGAGTVAGAMWALLQSGTVGLPVPFTSARMTTGWHVILEPLAAQALMLVGPLIGYRWVRSRHLLDGFDLGGLSAASFIVAVAVGMAATQLGAGVTSLSNPGVHLLALLNAAFVHPAVSIVSTGLISAAVWLRTQSSEAGSRLRMTTVGLAAAVQLVMGLLLILPSTALSVVGGLVMTVLVLALSRHLIRVLLRAEASPAGPVELAACRNCYYVAPQAKYCGQCGTYADAVRSPPGADFVGG